MRWKKNKNISVEIFVKNSLSVTNIDRLVLGPVLTELRGVLFFTFPSLNGTLFLRKCDFIFLDRKKLFFFPPK